MPNLDNARALRMAFQGARALASGRPLALSLEVTHSCTCDCAHCDKGGAIVGEKLAPPERFGSIVRELEPLFAQISGGEPLLRRDIHEIVRAVRLRPGYPYVVFVTNASLLTEEIYLDLKRLGVDEFSISLDFPDERHDANRVLPGLYAHLQDLIPKLAAHGNRDITLISVIRADNLDDLPALAEHAVRWNVAINFTAYTSLRTNDPSKSVRGAEGLALLRRQIDSLIRIKRRSGRVFTAESVLNRYYEYFAHDSNLPPCRAGIRSLVVNPDGRLAPCAMQPVSFDTREELVRCFSRSNQCGGCLVSLRANTERTVSQMVADGWRSLRQIRAARKNDSR
jgi:MoaA/NifB/PqqE/SkfB family radical SAM enzyme